MTQQGTSSDTHACQASPWWAVRFWPVDLASVCRWMDPHLSVKVGFVLCAHRRWYSPVRAWAFHNCFCAPACHVATLQQFGHVPVFVALCVCADCRGWLQTAASSLDATFNRQAAKSPPARFLLAKQPIWFKFSRLAQLEFHRLKDFLQSLNTFQ